MDTGLCKTFNLLHNIKSNFHKLFLKFFLPQYEKIQSSFETKLTSTMAMQTNNYLFLK